MRKIYALDAETDPFEPEIMKTDINAFIWGLYSEDENGREEYHTFGNTHLLIDFLCDKEAIVYAHNGGKFDYHMPNFLDYLEPEQEIKVISGRLSQFKIGACEFRDSMSIIPVSLGNAGDKLDIDYMKMHKDRRAEHMLEIEVYLKRDCKELYKLVMAFIDQYGLNLTIAGTALKFWDKLSGLDRPVTNSAFYNDYKRFYYGGRVEAFKTGIINKPFSVVDINSAYPYAMTFNHPISDELTETDDWDEIVEILSGENGGATFLTLDCISQGALPVRGKTGSLSFPNDGVKRRYHVTGWEYITGVKRNKLHEIELIELHYPHEHINFSQYVEHFTLEKTAAKNGLEKAKTTEEKEYFKQLYLFSKLMMNSLYGKYASNFDEYEKYTVMETEYIDASIKFSKEVLEKEARFSGTLGKWAIKGEELDESEKRFLNVTTSASITGFVRAYLFDAICECGVSNVLYCDTDSIATHSLGALSIDPYRLGAWDIEAGNCPEGAIAGKKLYAFKYRDKEGYKTATKGVRVDARTIYDLAQGAWFKYRPMAPTFSMSQPPRYIERIVKMV